MPRYDYQCTRCGLSDERYVDDRPDEVVCRECGAVAKRQFPTGAHLRFGPDVYERDYREMEANGELTP